MKKFILGLTCGIVISATTVAFATDTIQAYLSSTKYVFNGQSKELGSEYITLNYNGHNYVPVRFIAESLGASIEYDNNNPTVFVNSTTPSATTSLNTIDSKASNDIQLLKSKGIPDETIIKLGDNVDVLANLIREENINQEQINHLIAGFVHPVEEGIKKPIINGVVTEDDGSKVAVPDINREHLRDLQLQSENELSQ
ncbi:MAG TPA: copper amine oxidase N-terminal domain-containing protein [Bacillota bacterium]|nr:copper amine oxidase N-terminal domain-containing protein [Bacillota bacterium]